MPVIDCAFSCPHSQLQEEHELGSGVDDFEQRARLYVMHDLSGSACRICL